MNALNMYDLAGWLGIGLGITLFMLGIFARRFVVTGTPRCAKCGYALIAADGGHLSLCPECGRQPRSPTEMYTLRRRWLLLGLGSLFLVGGIVIPFVPPIQQQGWTSVLPMSVQIGMWDTGDKALRDRIHAAYTEQRLSPSQLTKLQAKVRSVLLDSNATSQLLSGTIHYISSYGSQPILLDERDLSAALADGNNDAKSLLLTVTTWKTAPETEALRTRRREMVWVEKQSKRAIAWLIKAPSDDPQDMDLIRKLVIESDVDMFFDIQRAFDRADPSVLEGISVLLDHVDPMVRLRAINCYDERLGGSRIQLHPEIDEQILKCCRDPDPQVRRMAIRMIQNLPSTSVPAIAETIRSVQSGDDLSDIMHQAIRIDPDPVGLLPVLNQIAQDPSRPIRTRIEAAESFEHIRARSDTDAPREAVWGAYDALTKGIAANDAQALITFGAELGPDFNATMLVAIARHLSELSPTESDLDEWFTRHPGIAAVLQGWQSETETAPGRSTREILALLLALITEERSNLDDPIGRAATDSFAILFPEAPETSASP